MEILETPISEVTVNSITVIAKQCNKFLFYLNSENPDYLSCFRYEIWKRKQNAFSKSNIDDSRLLSTVLKGRKVCSFPVIVGSHPPDDDKIWAEAQEKAMKVAIPPSKENQEKKIPVEINIKEELGGEELAYFEIIKDHFDESSTYIRIIVQPPATTGLGGTNYQGEEHGYTYEGIDLTLGTICKRNQLLTDSNGQQNYTCTTALSSTIYVFCDLENINNEYFSSKKATHGWGFEDVHFTKEEFNSYFNKFCESSNVERRHFVAVFDFIPDIRAMPNITDMLDEEKRIADTESRIIKTNILVDTRITNDGYSTTDFPAPLLQATYLQNSDAI
ncbi:14240_t:CDS:2 [Dentiscutata erythropus]|uniref:14240_t:CDS:1 n=1 Tax=Dentiscutata erythropus TaxID=1348616 RepID=A0A9N9HRT8_9GLOM|nr:14240_t:CDS:2 [Dentiscutata erythropus]